MPKPPPVTRADFLLLLSAGSLPWFFLGATTEAPAGLEVHSPQGVEVFPLQKQLLTIKGRLGDSQIEIESAAARFLHAPCADKYCLQAGWLTRPYQSALCLPNAVGILLLPAKERFDSIHY
jgi:hypothetical protein